ncbi:ras-related protein Rab-19 isoform X2 [Zootoca vivipara]|uniref:ras-related protein Rab-19 isoform X2 n=1 Tax=Zootoca vivipara TaxID=8524 RepID=UPI00293BF111|nr:ras-related protein Rab-19 isoform X2 [Zootoca vivipara]
MAAGTRSPRFKMILLGDFGVGKTTLFHRIKLGRFLEGDHPPGQHSYTCEKTLPLKLNSRNCQVQISLWDTAGEERFLSLSRSYYRDADAVLLVYSLQHLLSFDSLLHWLYLARQYCADGENVDRSLQEMLERLFLRNEFQHSSLHLPLQDAGYYGRCGC